MNYTIILYIMCLVPALAFGQQQNGISSAQQVDSLLYLPLQADEPVKKHMYNVRLGIDLPLAIGFSVTTRLGFRKLVDKEKSTEAEILALNYEEDVAAINRWTDEPQYSPQAEEASDIFFFSSFALGFTPLLDGTINHDYGRVMLMYWEALAITGTIYSMTASNVDKYRPAAYSSEAPMEERLEDGMKNSFPAGHPALTATASFFAAKIFADHYPHRKGLKIALYSGAAGLTLGNAYFRWKSGKHFPTDLAIGMASGTLVGILVPELHKIRDKEDRLSLTPFPGGLNITYRIE